MTQIEQIKAEIERLAECVGKASRELKDFTPYMEGELTAYEEILSFIESLEKEQTDNCPSQEIILRVAKLHKVWSIMAPWENIEDFVKTNWNSKNIE